MMLILLLVCIFFINATNQLVICSFFFTLSLLIINSIADLYGKKRAFYALILSIIINAAPIWQKPTLILPVYFISLCISFCFSINLSAKLRSAFNFPIRNMIGSASCILIDVSILALAHLLICDFPLDKVISIGIRSLFLKGTYILIISALIYALPAIQKFCSPCKKRVQLK